jgi:hypothetical protein
MDTVFIDTPMVDCGVTAAQIFVRRESSVAGVYGLKTYKEFVNTLEVIFENGSHGQTFQ